MPDPEPTKQQTIRTIFAVTIAQLANALKGYHDQHQATGCTCALCKEAERVLRTVT